MGVIEAMKQALHMVNSLEQYDEGFYHLITDLDLDVVANNLRTAIEQMVKAEALQVLTQWDEMWERLGKPGVLGETKSKGVEDEVIRLRQRVQELERANGLLQQHYHAAWNRGHRIGLGSAASVTEKFEDTKNRYMDENQNLTNLLLETEEKLSESRVKIAELELNEKRMANAFMDDKAKLEERISQLEVWTNIFSEWESPGDVHEALIDAHKDVNALNRLLLESQAREAKLREALERVYEWSSNAQAIKLIEQALTIPTDDTALKEFKKKVLLDAAEMMTHYEGSELLRYLAEDSK